MLEMKKTYQSKIFHWKASIIGQLASTVAINLYKFTYLKYYCIEEPLT